MCRLQNEEGQLDPSFIGSYNPQVLKLKRMPVKNISFSPTRSPLKGQASVPQPRPEYIRNGGSSLPRTADLFVLRECESTTHCTFLF